MSDTFPGPDDGWMDDARCYRIAMLPMLKSCLAVWCLIQHVSTPQISNSAAAAAAAAAAAVPAAAAAAAPAAVVAPMTPNCTYPDYNLEMNVLIRRKRRRSRLCRAVGDRRCARAMHWRVSAGKRLWMLGWAAASTVGGGMSDAIGLSEIINVSRDEAMQCISLDEMLLLLVVESWNHCIEEDLQEQEQ